MQGKRAKPTTINQYIMDTVKNKKPETVEQLVKLVKQQYSLPEPQIINHILNLQNHGKLIFKEHSALFPSTRKGYLFSAKAVWYWTITALALATATTVFTIPENAFPIVYARYVLGSVFTLFLPGYSLIKALFPTKVPIPTRTKELDIMERVVLSVVTSPAIVPITSLLLNYTPWGITSVSVTFSLLALTIAFATAALMREHEALAKEIGQK